MSQIIKIQRNRYFATVITIENSDGSIYELQSNEKIVFGVKSSPENTEYDIKKELTSSDKSGNGYLLTLTTADTNITPCTYRYDVALKKSTGELEQIIDCTQLIITDAVVRSDNI